MRAQIPCLTHTDANFANIIIAPDAARLIDWDFPAVRYPLEELEALEEHAYLNGMTELPPAFFDGYGREVSRPLLRLYRLAGCLGGLSNPEATELLNDPALSTENRTMLIEWEAKQLSWLDQQAQTAMGQQ